MKIAYIRVSTVDQNEKRQIQGAKDWGAEKIYTEKASGKNISDRPSLQEMLSFARDGDEIYVHDFSRLARSTKDLLSIVESLNSRNINLVSKKENIDTSTPQGKLMLTMIGAIYEFERANLLERQAEGIAIAKAEGKYKGRTATKIAPELWDKYLKKYNNREINKVQMAKILHISRPTLDKLLSKNLKKGWWITLFML